MARDWIATKFGNGGNGAALHSLVSFVERFNEKFPSSRKLNGLIMLGVLLLVLFRLGLTLTRSLFSGNGPATATTRSLSSFTFSSRRAGSMLDGSGFGGR